MIEGSKVTQGEDRQKFGERNISPISRRDMAHKTSQNMMSKKKIND